MMYDVIFDLDGTLALIDHRRHFVEGDKKDWDAFFAACVDDEPNASIIYLLNTLWEHGAVIHIFSGRSDSVRQETEEWLDTHIAKNRDGQRKWTLLMREKGDYTPDEQLKRQWYENSSLNVKMVFDDRQKVVDMWRSLGLTCLQVANGNF